jgi:hypothetical protein
MVVSALQVSFSSMYQSIPLNYLPSILPFQPESNYGSIIPPQGYKGGLEGIKYLIPVRLLSYPRVFGLCGIV